MVWVEEECRLGRGTKPNAAEMLGFAIAQPNLPFAMPGLNPEGETQPAGGGHQARSSALPSFSESWSAVNRGSFGG
jgi:hypothetical protein